MAVQLTEEQFHLLLQRCQTQEQSNNKNFTHCTARFDGTRLASKVEEFLTTATIYKSVENINDENAITGLPLLLTDEANLWWNGVRDQVRTWEEATNLIRKAFAPHKPNHKLFSEIFGNPQTSEVPIDRYVAIQRDLMAQMSRPLDEEWQLDIVYGLLQKQTRNRFRREEVASFDQLLTKVRSIEETFADGAKTPDTKNHSQERKTRERCEFCRNWGHTITECRKRTKNGQTTNTSKTVPASTEHAVRCYGCNAPGVFRRNCPRCNRDANQDRSHTTKNVGFCAIQTRRIRPRPRPAVPVEIAGIEGTAFLDTAAGSSVASASLYRRLIATGHVIHTETVDATFADSSTKVLQVPVIRTDVSLCGKKIPTTFVILSQSEDTKTLLGADFIEDSGLIPDLAGKTFCFRENRSQVFPLTQKDEVREKVNPTPPQVEITTILKEMTTPSLIEPMEEDHYGPPPPAGRSIDKMSRDGCWTVYQAPGCLKYMWADALEATDHIGNASLAQPHTDVQFASLHLRPHEGLHLTRAEREEFNSLLDEYEDLFADDGPPTPFAEHAIETGTSPPISVPPYRLTPQKKEMLRAKIDKMLDNGIIEECDSPWAAPVVLVPKPDGQIRICVDYRKLNSVTTPDAYPLPRLDDLLQTTGKIGCISTMDLQAGYWQVRVRQQDKDKTTFICPFGLYRFTRMPFGLRNAPATFQRLVDRFKTGLSQLSLHAYLDDLILLTTDGHEHTVQIGNVFERMRQYQLRMRREKCFFGCPEVKYLGHRISADGIKPDPEKIQAIVNMKAPSNVKHAHTFLQTCSWFRRFIPEFANIAKPLSDLLRKTKEWEWGPAQQQSFDTLKEKLVSAPILQQADMTKPFVLRTDASAYAIGAALLQGEGNAEKPIEYGSRLLSSAERNYSTTEREALAIVWAVNKFRGYIEENSALIITDHQPLSWLMSLKSPTGRLARWALQLQPYNLTIKYTPGKANVLADLLSRPQCDKDNENTCSLCSVHIDVPTRGAQAIREEQLRDPEIARIITDLTSTHQESTQPWLAKGYVLNQGVLYHYTQDDDYEDAQLVVPVHERPRVLREYHDAPTAGHCGVERTLRRITSRYYWPGIRRYVADNLKTCIECQRYKPNNTKPAGLLQTPTLQQRMEVVSIDLFGPLPPSEDDHRWILIIQDYATKWVELFPLIEATAEKCAWTFVDQVCFRYGLPRRLISDNGTQFISAVMQKITFCLGITQSFVPVYHPEANPVERANRDLKCQLAIQIGDNPHSDWPAKLPTIRFSMNTARCQSTGFTAAYLMFGRELRTVDDVTHDLRSVVVSENFVTEATPKLLQMADTLLKARERHEVQQNRWKKYADHDRQPSHEYQVGDLVLVSLHQPSKARQSITAKFLPRRDGPYVIRSQKGPTSYDIETREDPPLSIGVYHTSQLKPYHGAVPQAPPPVAPVRRRGRPRKHPAVQSQ